METQRSAASPAAARRIDHGGPGVYAEVHQDEQRDLAFVIEAARPAQAVRDAQASGYCRIVHTGFREQHGREGLNRHAS
ncbi:hypothetical protein ACFRNJ_34975 [Streptomyces sp. NPDC056721]|uniref:hypothetical protein n=1 Tax=Streptomyces sp. NPDC056721 TaxID=3345923 RepID=UPI00369BCE8C